MSPSRRTGNAFWEWERGGARVRDAKPRTAAGGAAARAGRPGGASREARRREPGGPAANHRALPRRVRTTGRGCGARNGAWGAGRRDRTTEAHNGARRKGHSMGLCNEAAAWGRCRGCEQGVFLLFLKAIL